MQQSIQLTGLHCAACQKLITKRIMKISGIKEVKVQLNGNTQIYAERNISNEEIKAVLAGTDYQVI